MSLATEPPEDARWACDRCGESRPDDENGHEWRNPTAPRLTFFVCDVCAFDIESNPEYGSLTL